jgi:hypothetical protein
MEITMSKQFDILKDTKPYFYTSEEVAKEWMGEAAYRSNPVRPKIPHRRVPTKPSRVFGKKKAS